VILFYLAKLHKYPPPPLFRRIGSLFPTNLSFHGLCLSLNFRENVKIEKRNKEKRNQVREIESRERYRDVWKKRDVEID
jgi:hypothetical protein